jgi:hypothetical protein
MGERVEWTLVVVDEMQMLDCDVFCGEINFGSQEHLTSHGHVATFCRLKIQFCGLSCD